MKIDFGTVKLTIKDIELELTVEEIKKLRNLLNEKFPQPLSKSIFPDLGIKTNPDPWTKY